MAYRSAQKYDHAKSKSSSFLFISTTTRGKSKQEQLSCEQFLQQIEICRTFLRAKQVGEKRARFQFVVEIAQF